MHISIPESEEAVEVKGGRSGQALKYVSYNVHINGTYHCSARFSKLLALHELLKREFGAGCLEQFPGKSFFYMRPDQAHYRRLCLQRWIQKIAQQPLICQSETFQSFLLNAQKEVERGPEEDVQLEIFLVNGKSVNIDVVSTDQTDDVLETVCSVIQLNTDLTYYFGLYLVDETNGDVIVRKLQDFESPYISLQRAGPNQKIQLRKAYYDVENDKIVQEDPIALNLLYIETIADIKSNGIRVPADKSEELDEFRKAKDRASFLNVARTLPGYGFTWYGDTVSSFPKDGTTLMAALGQAQLVLVLKGKSTSFAVQRMKCWRTYTTPDGVELEFEYYFDPKPGHDEGRMSWVKLLSPRTIHIAMCLQSLVEEMIRMKQGKPIKKPSDRVGKFKPRRQTNRPPDLSFLTSDAGSAQTSAEASEAGSAPPTPLKKVSVTLSDLMARVKTEEDEDDEPLDFAAIASGNGAKPEKDDPDDYDSDEDERAGLAALAGL